MLDPYAAPQWASPWDLAFHRACQAEPCEREPGCGCPKCRECKRCHTHPDYGELDEAGRCVDCRDEGWVRCSECAEWTQDADADGACPACHRLARAELLELLARVNRRDAERCGIVPCGGFTEHQVCRPEGDFQTLMANARRAEAMALRARLADGEEPVHSAELDVRPSEPPEVML